MFVKIKNAVLAHILLSVVASLIVIVGIGGASYFVSQINEPSGMNLKEGTIDTGAKSCTSLVKIGTIVVEKDPAGDPEAWLRFDYTASQTLNCNYTITFYDNQEAIIRTISNVEDTFQSPSGQIYNGYSSTPYQAGMTARVAVQ